MAYRRRQGNPRPATYEEYVRSPRDADENPSSIAAQAIRASSSLKDASLSSVYAESAFSSFTSSTEYKDPGREEHPSPPRGNWRGWVSDFMKKERDLGILEILFVGIMLGASNLGILLADYF